MRRNKRGVIELKKAKRGYRVKCRHSGRNHMFETGVC